MVAQGLDINFSRYKCLPPFLNFIIKEYLIKDTRYK